MAGLSSQLACLRACLFVVFDFICSGFTDKACLAVCVCLWRWSKNTFTALKDKERNYESLFKQVIKPLPIPRLGCEIMAAGLELKDAAEVSVRETFVKEAS